MRHDKLEQQLELMLLLTSNKGFSVDDLCTRLGISRRNFYYYLDFFRDCGFIVNKEAGRYNIDRNSPFFKKLIERISFNEAEVIIMQRLLNSVTTKSAVVRNLQEKLRTYYDYDILSAATAGDQQQTRILDGIYQAIKYKRMAVFKRYTSPHGLSQRDRLVEPFCLMNGNQEVRCYELATRMNKTFKLSRMEDVEVLADEWQHENKHKRMYTDIFMFSGERFLPIKLRLGTLAAAMMREEYPASATCLEQEDATHWLLNISVCSYTGIGRFVLGLFDDVEIIADEAFRDYIRQRVLAMSKRISVE